MTRSEIIKIQEKIGTEPDGFWGPKSIAACQSYLRSLTPKEKPWPKPDDASMRRFYGDPGDESNLFNLSVVGIGVWYEGNPVKTIRCHKKVADSLLRVLSNVSQTSSEWVLGRYAGCYNYRAMRGGSRMSKHAWGAAIDFDPANNGLRQSWPSSATMPFEVMECFAREGWTSAGAFWGRDAMHFEATC